MTLLLPLQVAAYPMLEVSAVEGLACWAPNAKLPSTCGLPGPGESTRNASAAIDGLPVATCLSPGASGWAAWLVLGVAAASASPGLDPCFMLASQSYRWLSIMFFTYKYVQNHSWNQT